MLEEEPISGLGKEYTTAENVRKILRSLPKSWEPKVTAIQEAKDLSKLPLEELIGSLMTHEIVMKGNMEEDVKKKKSLALKSTSFQRASESEEELNEEELAYLSKKFKKHFKKRHFPKKTNSQDAKGEKNTRDIIICYECKKAGHVRSECPLLRKSSSRRNKKAMKATWDESDGGSDSESGEEVANLCFMAFGDEDDDEEVCLRSIKNKWYLDSGYSKHMTGDHTKFTHLEMKDG
ncbi:uncharacterized protein LOC111013509 [Momordica charantia]|uniref:Uncharacterized protein LOC111013509 n=1 Tax=Momordica charantia TaxID=3673 RepID=A0A6J1CR79_MOMCH|nr:uncharacterized protein LOC111013509 [Momordica charantia]